MTHSTALPAERTLGGGRLHTAAAALLAAATVLSLTSGAAAQDFRTPDRQFHNQTSFPLEGRHRTVECESCHLRGVYKGTPATCFDCHWVRRQDDRYRLQLGTRCEQCHRPSGWADARWDHGAMTAMPLNAAHRQVACVSCHRAGTFVKADMSCASCHARDYQAAREPNHAAAGFPMTCETCHRPGDSSFTGATFNHAAVFPLTGVHARQTCATCHANNVYRGTARECVGCHQDDYARTTMPNHASAGFSTACESCHRATDTSFRGTQFNHAAVFALVGVHAQQSCATCHVNNVFRGTSRECVGCHQDDYARTTAPNHAASGFSTACESCHRATDTSFGGAQFNHAAVFALVGVHAQQSCVSCHVNNVFRGTSRECVGCHQDDYARTAAPNHAAAGFSTSCESCHRATDPSFRGATFNHSAVFALVGVHAQQACATCHVNNVYRGTARTCIGCHQDDYAQTTSPNHAAAGFPTSCESCHRATDTMWQGATFNHRFPITSGPHRETCATCHTSSASFQVFTCLVCHEHSQARMDEKHKERAGYRYDSLACYSCHPTGRH